MVRSWRVIFLVCMLAIGVTGIGATAHVGMTMHGAAAASAVASGDLPEDELCLFHCLSENDLHVTDGMLAIAAGVMAAILAVVMVSIARPVLLSLVPRAQFARYYDPGLLLTVCKRE